MSDEQPPNADMYVCVNLRLSINGNKFCFLEKCCQPSKWITPKNLEISVKCPYFSEY